ECAASALPPAAGGSVVLRLAGENLPDSIPKRRALLNPENVDVLAWEGRDVPRRIEDFDVLGSGPRGDRQPEIGAGSRTIHGREVAAAADGLNHQWIRRRGLIEHRSRHRWHHAAEIVGPILVFRVESGNAKMVGIHRDEPTLHQRVDGGFGGSRKISYSRIRSGRKGLGE